MAVNKKQPQTGGLQEKKVKVAPTKEEIKQEQKDEKAKRKEKAKERKKNKPSFIVRIREMFGELRKVTWPNAATTFKQTGIVLGIVLIFSIVIFGIDQGLLQLFKLLTKGLS